MTNFVFKIENFKREIKALGGIDDLFTYKHENGYIQSFIADLGWEKDNATDEEIFNENFEYFKQSLENGSNKLYKAYSMLESGYIDANGEPVIELDFEDADIFIETGKLPSVEKLTTNESNKGKLIVDENAVNKLLNNEEI